MQRHSGKLGSVEIATLLVIVMVFVTTIYSIYKSDKSVDSEPIPVNMCPVVYEKGYTEVGTIEYMPVFKCEEE